MWLRKVSAFPLINRGFLSFGADLILSSPLINDNVYYLQLGSCVEPACLQRRLLPEIGAGRGHTVHEWLFVLTASHSIFCLLPVLHIGLVLFELGAWVRFHLTFW